jgi:hypothetical protein
MSLFIGITDGDKLLVDYFNVICDYEKYSYDLNVIKNEKKKDFPNDIGFVNLSSHIFSIST